MGVWVCASSETVWFPTLIGQKQGSLRAAIGKHFTFINVSSTKQDRYVQDSDGSLKSPHSHVYRDWVVGFRYLYLWETVMGKQNALYKLGVLVVLPALPNLRLYLDFIIELTFYQEMETLNSEILMADSR